MQRKKIQFASMNIYPEDSGTDSANVRLILWTTMYPPKMHMINPNT